ncbi:MAG TPA: glycosyltransferase [Longimicrobiales bacterium]|nr:glycosyltransferase [Longimicrobiales bacterium]
MNPTAGGRAPGPVITHLVAPAEFGGLESMISTLAPAQQRAGWTVNVVGSFESPPEAHPFWIGLAQAGIPAIPLVCPGRRYLRERRELARLLRELGTTVLHSHGYRPDIVGAPVARRLGLATVTTVHGFTGGGARNRLYEWLQRRSFRRFDAVVAVSSGLRTEIVQGGVPPRRVHLIRNAWGPSRLPLDRGVARSVLGLDDAAPEDGPVLGWVGRMTGEKAPDVALQAFLALARRAEASSPRLVMVGDGPMRPELEAAAARGGLAHRIHFPGVVAGAGLHLKAFDAVILSSWTEGTPIVLLEAMAAEVPVVSTAVGGIPDVVSEAEAHLVPAGDASGLARALEEVLADAPDARRRAGAARRRLERDLSVDDFARRYGEVYRTCLGGRLRDEGGEGLRPPSG